jgi:hypothetical protein
VDRNTIATLVLPLVNSLDDGASSQNCPEANEVDAGCANDLIQRICVRAQALSPRECGRALARVGGAKSACSASLVTASCRVVTVMGSMMLFPGTRPDSSVWWRDQTPL